MDERCAAWTLATNRELADAGLPLRVVRLGTVWTMLFTEPGRYNWLLQYYLRAEGRDAELGRHGTLPEQHGFLGGGLRRAAGRRSSMPPAG